MIQKRLLMTLALPAAAAAVRFAANRLRSGGRGSIADRLDQVTDLVSPRQQRRGGLFGR